VFFCNSLHIMFQIQTHHNWLIAIRGLVRIRKTFSSGHKFSLRHASEWGMRVIEYSVEWRPDLLSEMWVPEYKPLLQPPPPHKTLYNTEHSSGLFGLLMTSAVNKTLLKIWRGNRRIHPCFLTISTNYGAKRARVLSGMYPRGNLYLNRASIRYQSL
jgi:hypothetical protein